MTRPDPQDAPDPFPGTITHAGRWLVVWNAEEDMTRIYDRLDPDEPQVFTGKPEDADAWLGEHGQELASFRDGPGCEPDPEAGW